VRDFTSSKGLAKVTEERDNLKRELEEATDDAACAKAALDVSQKSLDKMTEKYEEACRKRSVWSGKYGRLVQLHDKLKEQVAAQAEADPDRTLVDEPAPSLEALRAALDARDDARATLRSVKDELDTRTEEL
jgi:chromosome segregation ATPase